MLLVPNNHNACLNHILKHYNKGEHKFTDVKVWTDNCAAQYKCRQNFVQVAMVPNNHEHIKTFSHSFAQKYQFKGPWDAAGKVVKAQLRKLELQDRRAANAYQCFLNSEETLPNSKLPDWDGWKEAKDEKVLKKTPWKVTKRFLATYQKIGVSTMAWLTSMITSYSVTERMSKTWNQFQVLAYSMRL